MIMRPVDQEGDVLPVLASASLLKGIQADQELVTDRLTGGRTRPGETPSLSF